MDGPNVNWKFLELLQQDHAEEFGSQLIVVGSCGLHALHNSFKGDVIIQQFEACLSLEAKSESFSAFQPMQTRLDVFLHGHLCKSYPELWTFCKKLLLLSHGQSTMERGFSLNKEVEEDNMQEDAIVAQRIICDYVSVCGGVLNVPLTKELLGAAASARSQYRLYLEEERRKQESQAQKQKRKAAEDHVEELRKKRVVLNEVATSLEKDADKLAEQAEGKAGNLREADPPPPQTQNAEITLQFVCAGFVPICVVNIFVCAIKAFA
ncbi:uncharacterized protein LOC143497296 [Brachyhypopomus gauderio]|uniref:uncharacterized protein LOC143497296 n=1 Tax=Brachyhypopomus gauderio TaxID=698409 RepID=UPI00404113B7